MGDLAIDAAVTGSDGKYTAELSKEWGVWGPNGGYVAAILLRAALAHSSFPRAAALTCHFLSVGEFAEAQIETTTLRRAKRAESVRVAMGQDGTPVAEALAWLVADGLDGLRHDGAQMPDVPGPDGLRSFDEQLPTPESGAPPPPRMWNNIEGRPVTWPLVQEEQSKPYAAGWYRFPAHSSDDKGRQLVLLDVLAWPAALNAHSLDIDYMAPNLDLSVQFHRPAIGNAIGNATDHATDEEWLFAEGFADVAEDGLIGFRTKVWSRAGALLADGSGQLLCRRSQSD